MNRWNFHLSISSRYNIMYYRVLISINFKSPHAIYSSENGSKTPFTQKITRDHFENYGTYTSYCRRLYLHQVLTYVDQTPHYHTNLLLKAY